MGKHINDAVGVPGSLNINEVIRDTTGGGGGGATTASGITVTDGAGNILDAGQDLQVNLELIEAAVEAFEGEENTAYQIADAAIASPAAAVTTDAEVYNNEVVAWDINTTGGDGNPKQIVMNSVPNYGAAAPYDAIETTFMLKVSHDGTDAEPSLTFFRAGTHNSADVQGIPLNPNSSIPTVLVFRSIATHGSEGQDNDGMVLVGSSYTAPVVAGDGRDSRIKTYAAVTATTPAPAQIGSATDLDLGFNHFNFEAAFNPGIDTGSEYRVHFIGTPSYDGASTPAEFRESGYAYFVNMKITHDGNNTDPTVVFYEENTNASLQSEEIPLAPTGETNITLFVRSNHGFVGGGEIILLKSSYTPVAPTGGDDIPQLLIEDGTERKRIKTEAGDVYANQYIEDSPGFNGFTTQNLPPLAGQSAGYINNAVHVFNCTNPTTDPLTGMKYQIEFVTTGNGGTQGTGEFFVLINAAEAHACGGFDVFTVDTSSIQNLLPAFTVNAFTPVLIKVTPNTVVDAISGWTAELISN